jgi:hypothetical protein
MTKPGSIDRDRTSARLTLSYPRKSAFIRDIRGLFAPALRRRFAGSNSAGASSSHS